MSEQDLVDVQRLLQEWARVRPGLIPSTPHPDREQLWAFAADEVSLDEKAAIATHVRECGRCSEEVGWADFGLDDEASGVSREKTGEIGRRFLARIREDTDRSPSDSADARFTSTWWFAVPVAAAVAILVTILIRPPSSPIVSWHLRETEKEQTRGEPLAVYYPRVSLQLEREASVVLWLAYQRPDSGVRILTLFPLPGDTALENPIPAGPPGTFLPPDDVELKAFASATGAVVFLIAAEVDVSLDGELLDSARKSLMDQLSVGAWNTDAFAGAATSLAESFDHVEWKELR